MTAVEKKTSTVPCHNESLPVEPDANVQFRLPIVILTPDSDGRSILFFTEAPQS